MYITDYGPEQDRDFEGRPASPMAIPDQAPTEAEFSDNGSSSEMQSEMCHLVIRGLNRMDCELGAVYAMATFFANPAGKTVSTSTTCLEVRDLQ